MKTPQRKNTASATKPSRESEEKSLRASEERLNRIINRETEAWLDESERLDPRHVWFNGLARADQESPVHERWTTWLLLGGRGAGKTRAGAEWIRKFVGGGARDGGPKRRIALVAESYADAREVMIEGPSGLMSIGAPQWRPRFESSRRRLEWKNGSIGYCFSAEDPDGLRGFQFDAAWSDPNVDFIGIDNYWPLADWRDGFNHADFLAGAASAYDLDYLKSNIEGGEGYDWYYAGDEDRAAQLRAPISDGAYGEDWIYRYKDIRGWWSNAHYNRPDGVREASPTSWTPQSKPIRFTEIGCPAVDKGANQPNVFVDAKSAESALPHFSSGARDDLAQRRLLEAHGAYWNNPAVNPVSPVYGGPMAAADRQYIYAWDGRPFPYFPARGDIWGDGANWEKGHWLNGRLGRAPLDLLVTALAGEAGVTALDTSRLKGFVTGYIVDRPLSPREMIDPLADVFQFDMVEAGDILKFQPRDAAPSVFLSVDDMVAGKDAALAVNLAQESDLPSAVRLGFLDEGADYAPAVAEARAPDRDDAREAGTELPAVLGQGEAEARARSILADANVMRETAAFALPASLAAIEPGDALRILAGPDADQVVREYRVTQIADGAARKIEAVRVSPSVYETPAAATAFAAPRPAPAYAPPLWELFDLPLLRDDADPAAPWFAGFADPWPGALALYRSSEGGAPVLAGTAPARAVMGRLEGALAPGASGRWRREAIRLRLSFGALAARSEEEVFAGANTLAVESGAGGFEVLQFRDAVLDPDGAWRLSHLLRGQAGSEAEALAGAAAGARAVLLSPAVTQVSAPFDLRDLEFDWSAAPAGALPSSDAFATQTFAFSARGLKPLSPAHLRAARQGGDIALSWIRRTRIGGDSWAGADVPLGEAFERYEVRVIDGGDVVRVIETDTPSALYAAAMQAADFPGGAPASLVFKTAQVSDLVGAGAAAEIEVLL